MFKCHVRSVSPPSRAHSLAAPQIGVDLAVFVYDCLDAHGRLHQGLICNPHITPALKPAQDTDYEGCLSLPGASTMVSRPDFAICRGQDQFGEPVTVKGTGTSRPASAEACESSTSRSSPTTPTTGPRNQRYPPQGRNPPHTQAQTTTAKLRNKRRKNRGQTAASRRLNLPRTFFPASYCPS